MKPKFSLSGMPDFSSSEMKKRKYVQSVIEEKFNLFGFSPISTSLIEKRSNLFGSYGEDGEKLIFQILRSGDYLNNVNIDPNTINSSELSPLISDKSLRYDLTVPFTRFIAENQSSITFPFKRYEIGSVFRADRPQKGRLRQFTQCDADIIGSTSLWLEVDLLNLLGSIFNTLKLNNLVIRINNRKLLEGIYQSFNSELSFSQFCIIIDKLDKIGINKVGGLLLNGGFSENDIGIIKDLFSLQGDFKSQIQYVLDKIVNNPHLDDGINELLFLFNKNNLSRYSIPVKLDVSLARGLDYYTGSIFEVVCLEDNIGSLAGGGRYGKLAEKFSLKNISGVGVSLGLDRLCIALESAGLFESFVQQDLDFLFINFGKKESEIAYSYITKLRELGRAAELYPDAIKVNKQMSYANKRAVKFVIMLGEEEIEKNKLTIKNMITGSQDLVSFEELTKSL